MDLLKLSMLKMHADCLEQGVQASPAEICDECMMAHNTILSYRGVTPATALMGNNPRDLTEFENTTVAARTVEDADDYLERSCRMRLIAKSCILKALMEHRIVEANRTRPQQVDESTLVPGAEIDIYRAPDSKAGAGWQGPGQLLEIKKNVGSAIVTWQGRPFLITPSCGLHHRLVSVPVCSPFSTSSGRVLDTKRH